MIQGLDRQKNSTRMMKYCGIVDVKVAPFDGDARPSCPFVAGNEVASEAAICRAS